VIANGYLRLDREEWIRASGSGERRSVGRGTLRPGWGRRAATRRPLLVG